MRKSDSGGGIGFTAYSDYPQSDTYYRIRSTQTGYAFRLEPHPDSRFQLACNSTSTGVDPAANTWYRFKLRAETEPDKTTVRAKVWRDGDVEPSGWQIDCSHSEAARLTSGTVGVWSMGTGEKYWDDLEVRTLLLAPVLLLE
jgi:hypothetical protein